MEKFYTQTTCDRCGGSLENGRTLSMFNTECICLKCKEAETKRPDYKDAVEADRNAIKQGNYNFEGIGLNNRK